MIKNKIGEVIEMPVDELVPNPLNNNKHPKDQIARLAKLIEYQGFRNPIIVSNQSGHIVCGHGRLAVAKKLGMEKVPVSFQDFDSAEQEYAAMTADNAIGLWAELDLSMVNAELPNLGPDFDLDHLGIKDFGLNAGGNETKTEEVTECLIQCDPKNEKKLLKLLSDLPFEIEFKFSRRYV